MERYWKVTCGGSTTELARFCERQLGWTMFECSFKVINRLRISFMQIRDQFEVESWQETVLRAECCTRLHLGYFTYFLNFLQFSQFLHFQFSPLKLPRRINVNWSDRASEDSNRRHSSWTVFDRVWQCLELRAWSQLADVKFNWERAWKTGRTLAKYAERSKQEFWRFKAWIKTLFKLSRSSRVFGYQVFHIYFGRTDCKFRTSIAANERTL